MTNFAIKSKEILFSVTTLEKKHKIITYISLLFLTISTYFLRTENQEIKINHATLVEKNRTLKHSMILFNRNYERFPLPVWQKVKRGGRFVIQYINPVYVDFFGHNFHNNQYEIIGKNNFELFPKKIAQTYYENDVAVSITGDIREAVEKFIDKNGETVELKVVKWRSIQKNKDTLIYGMVKEITKKKNIK